MVPVLKFCRILLGVQATNSKNFSLYAALRYYHDASERGDGVLNKNFISAPSALQSSVGIFWDLDNKPPKSFTPYEVATKLKAAVSSFGVVRHMVAYANHHTFSYVPQVVQEERKGRKLLNHLGNKGLNKPDEPYLCRVCGRKFYANEKLVNHFKQIHEREHKKRLNQIESAKGSRRVKLVAKYSMKMEKYKNAARGVLTAKVGYGLSDELKQAGFLVWTVSDTPQAADISLKGHMVDMMDHGRVNCVVLVSDDSDFVSLLKEARLRCLKTVVIGDANDGALKRTADAAFSWEEILMRKAKKEVVKLKEKWKDNDILKVLEWTYSEVEKKKFNRDDMTTEASEDENIKDPFGEVDENIKDPFGEVDDAYKRKEDTSAWWEFDFDDMS